MKTKKRFLALFLAVITVLTFAIPVWAAEPELSIDAEHSEDSFSVSPRVGCTVCKIGFLIQICEKQRYWDYVTEHNKNGKRCLINVFRSGGHYLCETCGATRPFDYADEFGGEHWCVENHSSCGIGDKSICSLGAQLPPDPFPYSKEPTDE